MWWLALFAGAYAIAGAPADPDPEEPNIERGYD